MLSFTMSTGGSLFSMRKEIIVTGEYFHVYSRGVDRRSTFNDDADRERFIRGMIAFNDARKREVNLSRMCSRPQRSATPLVKILCYALMPNHYHFLLKQVVDHGIATFMQRLGRGYAGYFNHRNDRTGSLWESEYKAVRIETDAQLLHTSRYIHLNPLKLFLPEWKIRGVQNFEVADTALRTYPWSSYPHFLGLINDHVTSVDILNGLSNGPDDYRLLMKEYLVPM